jgi:transmembrane sensor
MSDRDEALRDALREPHDEARARANWEAIARRRRPTPAVPIARGAWIGALGLVAVAAAAWLALTMRTPGPLTLPSGAPMAGMIAGEGAALDDGSRVTLDTGSRLEVLENAGDHVRFWLHEGTARFDVTPGGPRRWSIETGTVTVEVLGTSFSVARGEHEVRVEVTRGTVLVRGPTAPEGMQRLHAGDAITLSIDGATVAAAAPAPEATATVTPSAPISDVSIAAATPRAAPREASVHAATSEAEHAVEPGIDPEVAADDASGDAPEGPRMRDVDALRAAGRLDEAIGLLETIAADPTAGRERALAAFTRGRLELDRRRHPTEAAAAFAQAIELGLREPLREDALARRVESLSRAADAAGARAAAEEYARRYPTGRWQAEVARWSVGR